MNTNLKKITTLSRVKKKLYNSWKIFEVRSFLDYRNNLAHVPMSTYVSGNTLITY